MKGENSLIHKDILQTCTTLSDMYNGQIVALTDTIYWITDMYVLYKTFIKDINNIWQILET